VVGAGVGSVVLLGACGSNRFGACVSATATENLLSIRDFFHRDLVGVAFVFRRCLLLAVFMFLPMGVSFIISLTDLNIFSINEWARMQFIGIENYAKIVKDPIFWRALINTSISRSWACP
jgi:ABC-type sugar transport system permease subunit